MRGYDTYFVDVRIKKFETHNDLPGVNLQPQLALKKHINQKCIFQLAQMHSLHSDANPSAKFHKNTSQIHI